MKAVLAFATTCCLAFIVHATPITLTVHDIKNKELVEADYRLEEFVRPTSYKIYLNLADDFHVTKKFGIMSCTIMFVIDESATVKDKNVIRIHYGVDYVAETTKVQLVDKDGNVIPTTIAAPDPDTEIAVITLGEELDKLKEPYALTFTKLSGTLQDNMSGFYLSEYKVGDTTKYIATTQFQSTDARKAFPCFDEPFFKATFDVSITRPKAYKTVLFNTATKGIDVESGDYITTSFKETPTMSTYLVAFIVSTLDSISHPTSPYAIFFPEGMAESAKYALEMTPLIIDNLGAKLAITYGSLGNEQLYQAAIPDFSAGAMENWGLATYRETALLWDDNQSVRSKQRVCSVMAHEIAHMWFGDSVTMKWWSDTWLNEGFARYFEYHTTANVELNFDMRNQFVVEQQQVIFNADAVSSAQPLSSDVTDIYMPNQVSSKFGSITYNKGGSVLRMIERVMTEMNFRAALTEYLNEYKSKNTMADQLMDKFYKHGLKAGSMEEWYKKGGYPVVTVTREGNDAVLNQQRFLLDDKVDTTKWNIPITYSTKKVNPDYVETQATIWMDKSGAALKIEKAFEDTEMVILNVQGSGYYRVNYERGILETINLQLRTTNQGGVPPLNRAILIDDVMNMARVGYQSYDMALDLTKYLVDEVEYYPWVAAFNSFAFLNKRIENQEVISWFQNYILRMSEKLYKSVSFEKIGEKHMDILKTVLALQWSCESGVTDCTGKAKNLFDAYIANSIDVKVDPNLRSIVYCNGIRQSSTANWDELFTLFKASTVAFEKVTILAALGCTKDKPKLKEYLLKSLTTPGVPNTDIRKQDAYAVFTAVVNGNPENLDVALEFLIDKFSEISSSYASMNALSNIFNLLADRFTTAAQVKTFEDFLKANEANLGEAAKVGEGAVATAKANLAWTANFQATIHSWLDRERDNGSPAMTASVLVVAMAVFLTFFY